MRFFSTGNEVNIATYPNLWDLHTPLGVTGSNFTMKPEPRHPPAFGIHLEVRVGHASHNDVLGNLEFCNPGFEFASFSNLISCFSFFSKSERKGFPLSQIEFAFFINDLSSETEPGIPTPIDFIFLYFNKVKKEIQINEL